MGLFRIYRKSEFLGTAVLVGPRHLLTCAHVVGSGRKFALEAGGPADLEVVGVSPEEERDLALLRWPVELGKPPLWAHEVASGKEVSLKGFAAVDGGCTERTLEGNVTCTLDAKGWVVRLDVKSGVDHGTSGGVAIALVRGEARCVGLIQEGGKRALLSLMAGAAEIAPFLERHGLLLPGCPEYGPVAETDPDADIRRRYLAELAGRTAQVDIRGFQRSDNKATVFAIDDLYVPLKNRDDKDIEESVRKQRCLVVQGDAGSGKSTFLQRLAHRYAVSGERFPLPVRVVDLDRTIRTRLEEAGTPDEDDDPRWIAIHVAGLDWGLEYAFVLRQMEKPETVVLLDGLDEALSDARRRSLANLLTRAAKKYRRKCRFVVTTRPGVWHGDSRAEGFALDSIAELDRDARAKFFENWYRCAYPNDPDKARAEQEDLAKQANNDEVREMSGNPMMLTALACIHWNEGRLPHDRGELYKSVLEWMAKAREKRAGRVSAKKCLETLRTLAFGMQTWPEGRLKDADRMTAVGILEKAGMEARAAGDFLDQEELDSGIIVSREGGRLEFRHLTFQEYLAAVELMTNRSEQAQRATLLDGRRRYDVEWREFLRLCAVLVEANPARMLYAVLLGGAGESLADKARTVALVRLMAWDRREKEEAIEDCLYLEFVREMGGLFEGKADGQGLDLWSRGWAAEAWELLVGDPSRLRRPSDAAYWEPVNAEFEIGRGPVTVHEYGVYLAVCPDVERPRNWETQSRYPLRPVVYVSFHDAVAYCTWWSGRTERVIRVPEEGEWFLAAAGSAEPRREYPWSDIGGDGEPNYDRANYDGELKRVSPVGLFSAGAVAGTEVQDMAGNVWEWTASLYQEDRDWRVLRGGAWGYSAGFLRAAFRFVSVPGGRDYSIGFRVLREVSPLSF